MIIEIHDTMINLLGADLEEIKQELTEALIQVRFKMGGRPDLEILYTRPITYYVVEHYWGLITFTGNQWNDLWEWNKKACEKLPVDKVVRIISRITIHEASSN